MLRKLSGCAAAIFCTAALMAFPQTASAGNIITNGSFNTDLSGWTAVGPATCGYRWSNIQSAGVTGGYAEAHTSSPATCGLYQTVTLPAGGGTLTLNLGNFSNGNDTNDRASLEIRNDADAVLETLYSHNGGQAVDTVQARGPYDLSAYGGQTVRVYFETVHTTAPTLQQIDDVVLDVASAPAAVPTMSEWAMIGMGLALAGGAAFFVQRRRVAA